MNKQDVLTVTPEEREAIKKVIFTRTDEEIKNDTEEIKKWLAKQPHLPHDEGER